MQKAAHVALLIAALTYLGRTLAVTAVPFYTLSVEEGRLVELTQNCEIAKSQYQRWSHDTTRATINARQAAISAMNDCIELRYIEAHLRAVGVDEFEITTIKLLAIQSERVPIVQRLRYLELTQ